MKHRARLRFVLEGLEGFAVLGGVLCSWPVSKRWLKHWGSHASERERRWPGDKLVSQNHEMYTRAISIAASADTVWRWIVQFGLGRAGFYSYELLERLAGIPVTNVESIESTMQSLEVGDKVRLHPNAPGIPVAFLQRGKHICFGVNPDADITGERPDPNRSWSIYIESDTRESCRLLLRGCIEPLRARPWSKRLALLLEEPIDFVMEQRMLRTVKRLAEATDKKQEVT